MSFQGEDNYIERCFGQLEPGLQQDAIALAIDILLPLKQQLELLGDD